MKILELGLRDPYENHDLGPPEEEQCLESEPSQIEARENVDNEADAIAAQILEETAELQNHGRPMEVDAPNPDWSNVPGFLGGPINGKKRPSQRALRTNLRIRARRRRARAPLKVASHRRRCKLGLQVD